MRYLFLQRPFLHRFDHEAFRRSVERARASLGHRLPAADRRCGAFSGALQLRTECHAEPPAPPLPDPQGRAAAARAVRRVPLAGRRPLSGGRHVREAPRRPAGRSRHARRSRLLRQRHPRRDRQDREPPGRPARARRDRGVTRRALLRAGPASGQPRLALSAHRLDLATTRSSDGPMRSSEQRRSACHAGPELAAAACRRRGLAVGHGARPGPRRHRTGVPDRRSEPAGSDPRETARGAKASGRLAALERDAQGEGDPRDRGSRHRSTRSRRPRGRAASTSTRASSFPTRSPMPRAR